jgi:DNA-binding MarR family transcriptional regulator
VAEITDYLGPLLGRSHEALRVLSFEALAPVGLSPKAFGALTVLAGEGPLAQGNLARRQGIDRTTMVAVVDELERARAVRRRRDPRDRRAYALELTPEGARLLERGHAAVREAEDRFLAPLSTAERRALMATLRKAVDGAPDAQAASGAGGPDSSSSSSARMR